MISVGFRDANIHESYICRITGKTGNGQDVAVSGLLSEGYNLQSTSNYDQPMLDFSAGQKLQSIGAVAQEMTGGITSQTIANSIQSYQNESPVTMTLPLSFIALRDPIQEVSLAERYLLEMKAPNLREGVLRSGIEFDKVINTAKDIATSGSITGAMQKIAAGMSHRPSVVSVFISRHVMFPECLITDVEIQDESVNHKTGHALQKVINVTIAFRRTINNSEFAALFPF